jgi:hypothetical protein
MYHNDSRLWTVRGNTSWSEKHDIPVLGIYTDLCDRPWGRNKNPWGIMEWGTNHNSDTVRCCSAYPSMMWEEAASVWRVRHCLLQYLHLRRGTRHTHLCGYQNSVFSKGINRYENLFLPAPPPQPIFFISPFLQILNLPSRFNFAFT